MHLGGVLGVLGDVWRPLGDAVGGFGGVLRAILAVRCALGGVLGTSWRFLEASWGRLGGVLEVMLVASGRFLEASWRRLGQSWNILRHLGSVLGLLEGVWRLLGDVLGLVWGVSEWPWEALSAS